MRKLVFLLILLCHPVLAQSGETISPEALAPPRAVPIEESLPTLNPQAGPLHLGLRDAMSRALNTTPTLEKIDSRIRQAEYRVQEAYTPAYPTLNFEAQYSRVQPPIALPNGPVISPADNYQFSLVIRQALYTFGRMKWDTLAAKLSQRVVQEEYRGEVNRLITLVAQRYIEALLAREQVLNAQDELEAQLSNLRTSQLLFEQGVAARFDVLQNSAAASQAQQILIEAETAENISKARLLSLMDEPLDRPLELEPLALPAPEEQFDLLQAKSEALETRPDLRGLRWAVEEARARVELAETSNNPTLELRNTTVNQNATGFAPGTSNTTAIVLSVPLFDGGLSHWQKEQAVEAVHQLTEDLEQAERDAVLQIEEAFRRFEDRWRAIAVAEENVLQAEEALRVAVLRYQNGISTNVELLDSQAQRSLANFRLARARADYLLSRWEVWQAIGAEYPVEVPLPPEIRERLDAEGILLEKQDFLAPASGDRKLGPILPVEPSAPLPIRGLPERSDS